MILLDNIEEKISKLIRLKDFKDGKNIKKENCLLILQEKNVWQYTVYDDENLGFGFYSYNVTINWLDKFNFKCSCNCRNYKKYNSCLHIGAILWYFKDSLFKDNELEISDLFLKKYSCLSPDIKQEIKGTPALEKYFKLIDDDISSFIQEIQAGRQDNHFNRQKNLIEICRSVLKVHVYKTKIPYFKGNIEIVKNICLLMKGQSNIPNDSSYVPDSIQYLSDSEFEMYLYSFYHFFKKLSIISDKKY